MVLSSWEKEETDQLEKGIVNDEYICKESNRLSDEEKIFYSCEEIGEGDENFIIYAMSDGAPNIWAEIEESGELQLTAYLSHDIGEEKRKELQEKNYKIETAYAEFQLYTDEEGSVTALYNTALDGENAGESFAKAMYTFLYSMNQCIEDILVYVKQG